MAATAMRSTGRPESRSRPVSLALAGDTMLGRGVAERLAADPRIPLLDPALAEMARSADLFILNLECCISDRGAPIDEPGKPFHFRAPPAAAERLAELGVDCVSLANNHVLDYGSDALQDTLEHLAAAGIATAGAGPDVSAAQAAAHLTCGTRRLRVLSVADHPASYAAGPARAGIAFADLRHAGVPPWLLDATCTTDNELVLLMAHWGPNMTPAPVRHVRAAAAALQSSDATLVAGHSAHVPHGVRGRVLFDLGDFLDDYRVDTHLRNDLSLLWLVTLDADGPHDIEGVPVRLEYAYTRIAGDAETRELARLMERRCDMVGSRVELVDGRLVFEGLRAADC
jgi:poly-gamma-glutamate capsule biosynthesis protein CapA/YwtB (metallophosphatase superfamily)